jgi:hypothetical protein
MTRKNRRCGNYRPSFDFDKDSSAFTSSPFDFVATGLRTIKFLLFIKKDPQGKRCVRQCELRWLGALAELLP